ncbi:MAG: hypothetical protein FWD82_01840 [Defluviitaleaceae bacterium]|nr:hypothetical protein [Defluviitaleaceae bacterium]
MDKILMALLGVGFAIISIFLISSSINDMDRALEFSERNRNFYELDSLGENYIADVDVALALAEERALNYVLNRDYERYSHPELPVELQSQIRYIANSDGELGGLNDILNIVYLYFAEIFLNNLIERYETSIVSALRDEHQVLAVMSEILISTSGIDSNLSVSISVNRLLYVFEGNDLIERATNSRFTINSWVIW